MWKGVVKADGVEVPVKLFSAVEDRTVHFRLLSKQHHVPIKQRMVEPASGEEVPREHLHKGVELERGLFVKLEPAELESVQPKESRDIEVLHFLPRGALGLQWFDRPYYLGPDGADTRYFALAEALRRKGRIGLVRWVMRNTDYVGALSEHQGYLVLITLHHADEVIAAASLTAPSGKPLDARELTMAEQLVGALAAEPELEAEHDEYRERVRALVEAKAHGRKVKVVSPRKKPEQPSIAKALEASLAHLKKAANA